MSVTVESFSESSDDRSLTQMTPQMNKSKRSSKHRGSPSPCPICGVIISNSYNLTCHLRRHTNDKPFKCDQCPAAFILITELKRHKVSHSKERPFKCSLCCKSYKCIEILRIHMDSHGFNEYKCRYCDDKFKNYKLRSNHEISCHTLDNLKCRFCYKSFAEVKFREEHEKISHKKQLQSDILKVGAKSDLLNLNDNEIAYLELNDSVKTRKYDKRKSKPKYTLKESAYLLDTEYAFYPCKICSQRFKYRKDQVAHYEKFHREEFDKIFKKCKICGKLLTTVHYKNHIQAHAGIFPHNCTLCDYKSTRKGDLDNHMIVHTKEYKYKCSFCGKNFRNLGPSLLCEKKHAGKKDVKCNLCEKTFFSGLDLRRHVVAKHKTRKCSLCNFESTDRYLYDRHRQEHNASQQVGKAEASKKNMCEMCGLMFDTSRHFWNHMKSHKGVAASKREYFCSYCDFKGSSNPDVLEHCDLLHPTKVSRCEFCDYTTLNHNHFVNHMKNHISVSAQELYICATLERKHDKELASVHLECFICGFSSSIIEHMKGHIESHSEEMKPFDWFSSDMFYQSQKNDDADDAFLKSKKYKTLQIKDIALPVNLCKIPLKNRGNILANETYIHRGKKHQNEDKKSKIKIENIATMSPNVFNGDSEQDMKYEYSIKAESNDSDNDDSNNIIEINDRLNTGADLVDADDVEIKVESPEPFIHSDEPQITLPEDKESTGCLVFNNKTLSKIPVTIKIKKVYCKPQSSVFKRPLDTPVNPLSKRQKQTSNAQLNLNLEIVKNKLQNINGKFFLSLEDLCSLSKIKKESILKKEVP